VGVTKRKQGGTITRAPNDYGGTKSLQGPRKLANNVTSTFFNTVEERLQVATRGRQTCFLPRAPSNLVTPLGPWPLRPHSGCVTVCSMFVLLCRLQDNKFRVACKSNWNAGPWCSSDCL